MARRKGTRRGRGEGTVSERTDGRWIGQVTVGYDDQGKQLRKTVYGRSQEEALKKLLEIRSRLATGTFVDTKQTLAEYLDEWLVTKKHEVKLQTVEDYRYQLEHYVVPLIGKVNLEKLKPADIRMMCSRLAERISPQRANKCRRVLSGALSDAMRLELIYRNPCDAVKPMKVVENEMRLWTSIEAARFLDAARPHRLYPLFYLAMSTGLRRGELLGLRWQDVGESCIYVRQSVVEQRGNIMITTPKTEKSARRVVLSADVMLVLNEHRQRQDVERDDLDASWPDTGLVFVSETGTMLHPRNFTRTWHTLQKNAREAWLRVATEAGDVVTAKQLEAGKLMSRVRLHDLRHLHASMAIKAGVDAKVLADRLGHSRASFTLDRYTHLFEEQRDAGAVSLLDFLPQREPLSVN